MNTKWRHAVGHRNIHAVSSSPAPAFEAQHAAKADGVIRRAAFAITPQPAKLHHHHRCLSGVAVAELNNVIMAAFETATPIGGALTIFDAFCSGSNRREILPMQIQVQDTLGFWGGVYVCTG